MKVSSALVSSEAVLPLIVHSRGHPFMGPTSGVSLCVHIYYSFEDSSHMGSGLP